MPLVSIAEEGNFIHVYDFKVKPGKGDEFIALFNEFDYSADNLMHHSPAQVKDGVLCRDTVDSDRFYLIGEWRSVEEHRALLKEISSRCRPGFFDLLEKPLSPTYGKVVSSTPAEYLAKINQAKSG
jgi:quinol monooxygenase YgiN